MINKNQVFIYPNNNNQKGIGQELDELLHIITTNIYNTVSYVNNSGILYAQRENNVYVLKYADGKVVENLGDSQIFTIQFQDFYFDKYPIRASYIDNNGGNIENTLPGVLVPVNKMIEVRIYKGVIQFVNYKFPHRIFEIVEKSTTPYNNDYQIVPAGYTRLGYSGANLDINTTNNPVIFNQLKLLYDNGYHTPFITWDATNNKFVMKPVDYMRNGHVIGEFLEDAGRNIIGDVDTGQATFWHPRGAFGTQLNHPLEDYRLLSSPTSSWVQQSDNGVDGLNFDASRVWGQEHTANEFRPKTLVSYYYMYLGTDV